MSTVVISGNNYEIYGTSVAADAYWAADLGDAGAAWLAATATKRLQALVGATRLLDRQAWQGTPVGTPVVDVVLQWPRTNVFFADGTPVSSLTVPDLIVKGSYQLAGDIMVNPSLMSASSSGSNVKRAKADTVEVEFFTSTMFISGFFPQDVQDLVGQFLAGARASGPSGSQAFGTGEESQFDTDDIPIIR